MRLKGGFETLSDARLDAVTTRRSINFFGHLATAPGEVTVRDGDGLLRARWDVLPECRMRMVLPTRERVIEDGAWAEARDAARLAACREAAARGSHRLSMRDVAFARSRGFDPGLPAPLVRRVDGSETDGRPASCLIVPVDVDQRTGVAVDAIVEAGAGEGLVRPDEDLAGHPAYDAIPVMDRVTVHLAMERGGGPVEETWALAKSGEEPELTRLMRADGLRITCWAGHRKVIEADVPFALLLTVDGMMLCVTSCDPDTAEKAARSACSNSPEEEEDDDGPRMNRMALFRNSIMAMEPANSGRLADDALEMACEIVRATGWKHEARSVAAYSFEPIESEVDGWSEDPEALSAGDQEGAAVELTDGTVITETPWKWRG